METGNFDGKLHVENPHAWFGGIAVRMAAAMAASAMCLSSAKAEVSPTLGITLSGDTLEVAVPANSYDDTSKLYLVWGAGDCGEKISAWPRANRREYSGTLASTAATYQFSAAGIPAGSVVRAIVTSDVRLIDSWISLGNGQYINTGIKGNAAYGTEIKFRRTGASGAWASAIGSKLDNFTIGQNNNSTTSCYLRYQGVNGGLSAFSWSDETVPHTILVKHSINDGKGHVNGAYVDGTKVTLSFLDNKNKATTGPSGALGTDANDIFVGSANNGSGASCGRYYHAEWHYVRILDNNGYDMAHLVPAIRGNTASPEGVFYDTVTETVFANAGSGTIGYDTSANVTETIPFTTAYSASFPMAMTAYWTGLGDLANVNDPANWACTNAAGVEVSAAPDTNTIVFVKGATNFNVPAGQKLSYNELIMENCSLAANCDWSGLASSDTVDPIYTLQYLDAPKNSYIDTGFAPNNNTRVVFDITVRGTLESWFGVTDNGGGNWWKTSVFGVSNDGGGVYSGFGNSGGTPSPVAAVGRHTVDFDKGELKIDGVTHTTRSGQTFQLTHTLYLFADNKAGGLNIKNNNPPVRLHSCQIYDNGTLVRDYVPVQNGNEVCLYDRVNGTYARNIGSGAFAAGPSLGDKVGFYNVTRPTSIDATVNLAGHSLKLAHVAGTGTITDTVGGGELHVNVADGETVENATLTFAGQMRLVKDGAGTFVGAKAGQTYTGGTVATEGWLKSGAYDGAWGPAKALVTICKDEDADTGAGFDWAGKANDSTTTPYSFKIAGTGPDGDGAMISSAYFGGNFYNINTIADMELDGDATLRTVQKYLNMYGLMYNNNNVHALAMNGHTLTIVVADSFPFRAVTATGGGTIVCVPDTSVDVGLRRFSFYGAASDLSTTTLDVHDRCGLNVEMPVTVLNLIDRRTLQWNDGTMDNNGITTGRDSDAGMLTVLGRFQPTTTNLFTKTTLGDEEYLSPTLDLSLLSEPFGYAEDGPELIFAEGTTVTVDVGDRAIAVGDKLVSWSAIPDCAFSLVYSGETRPIEPVARTDGLYVKSTIVPAYATLDLSGEVPEWKFFGADGSPVPDWENGVTSEIQVRFASYEEYAAIRAQNVNPAEYLLMGSIVLPEGTGTIDMSAGFQFGVTPGVTIDVAGRSLKLPNSMVGGGNAFTVTSSVAGGELIVETAADETIANTAMALTGSLKLVKKGAGTLVGAKADQTYTDGTFVDAGIAQSGVYNGAWGPSRALVTIADGAAFDWNGMADATSVAYDFVVQGAGPDGSGCMFSSRKYTPASWWQLNVIGDLELAGNAVFKTLGTVEKDVCSTPGFVYSGDGAHVLTLNGHTLTINGGPRFGMRCVRTVGAGTVAVRQVAGDAGLSALSFYGAASDLSSATVDVGENCGSNVETGFKVGTYIDRRTTRGMYSANAKVTVLDCFRPTATQLLKTIELGDETHLSPTLDLSSVTGTYVIPASGYAMTYAPGVQVRVNLVGGTRTDLMALAATRDEAGKPCGYVVTWSARPENVDFVPSSATKADGFRLLADETGLLLSRRSGTVLIVR